MVVSIRLQLWRSLLINSYLFMMMMNNAAINQAPRVQRYAYEIK